MQRILSLPWRRAGAKDLRAAGRQQPAAGRRRGSGSGTIALLLLLLPRPVSCKCRVSVFLLRAPAALGRIASSGAVLNTNTHRDEAGPDGAVSTDWSQHQLRLCLSIPKAHTPAFTFKKCVWASPGA